MTHPSGSAFSRRTWLRGAAVAVTASALPGCDPDDPATDAGFDAGTDGAIPDVDAGPTGPLPPRERTYETFEHGVASGDPLTDAVILWTRVTTGMPGDTPPASVDVEWTIANDRMLSDVVATGTETTDASRDWTVKVDVTGLSAGTTYYYAFSALGAASPTGRTRTAPSGPTERLRFAVVSCSSLAHGFFHSYDKVASRADLDAVIHLGDYIYEYGTNEYGERRQYLPSNELLTLEDYRTRYAQYRREPPLAEAHRQHPFIAVWDDHESADNSWSGGANNHQPDEGPWEDRLSAATQAYREWVPIRDGDDPRKMWRTFTYGDLCELVMLDTRIWGREMQADGLTDPEVSNPSRQLLGADQETWLFERLTTSTARWKVIGQQVMMGQVSGFPNTDQWDGYPAARERLLTTIADHSIEDVFVLTGDIHTSWAFDLPPDPTDEAAYDPATGAGSLGVELVVTAITSPGLSGPLARAAASFVRNNRSLMWCELSRRGFAILDLTEARAQADWFFVGDVEDESDDTEEHASSWATASGASHLTEAMAPAAPRPDAPPLA